MTVTDTYIHTVTPTASAGEEWLLPFPVLHDHQLYVWTYNKASEVYKRVYRGNTRGDLGYTIRRDGDNVYVTWLGTSPNGVLYDVRMQRHLQGIQEGEYTAQFANSTPKGFQVALDNVVEIALQNMRIDLEDRKHWSPAGERITDVGNALLDAEVVNKLQVDSSVGGTTPPTIASGDVDQWATANGSGGYTWEPFLPVPDPSGNEYKYLSGTGWVVADILETVHGTKTEDFLLTDVDGSAWWQQVVEPHVAGTSPNNNWATGRAMYIHRYGLGIHIRGWQDFYCSPDLLPNMSSNRLTTIEDETEYDAAIGMKMDYTRQLKITKHTVECRRKPDGQATYKNYSGVQTPFQEWSDHPVYLGTFDNPTGDPGVIPFFCPHKVSLDSSWVSGDLNGHDGINFTFVMNTVSVTTSTVTFVASSLLHERYRVLGNPTFYYATFIEHPDPLDISFNVLWYKEKGV